MSARKKRNPIGKTATKVFGQGGYTIVKYHTTPVVMFNSSEIILSDGGWMTLTTKRRMNEASNEYRLGFSVSQKARKWYVDINGVGTVPYEDGMTIKRG